MTAVATEIVSISIRSELDELERVDHMVRSAAGRLALDEGAAGRVGLAVREAVVNAILHGNKGSKGKAVDVECRIDPDRLEVFVRDRGAGFDPAGLADPREPANLLKPNARGVFLMRTFADEAEFSTHPEGGTVVRLLKRKGQGGP